MKGRGVKLNLKGEERKRKEKRKGKKGQKMNAFY
jgi:hypothetical protein